MNRIIIYPSINSHVVEEGPLFSGHTMTTSSRNGSYVGNRGHKDKIRVTVTPVMVVNGGTIGEQRDLSCSINHRIGV